uniref:Uncharacterized protein n=1 Tax=Arundo donax TaxID=35708 RepID=A0A0A9B9B1_ARUDO
MSTEQIIVSRKLVLLQGASIFLALYTPATYQPIKKLSLRGKPPPRYFAKREVSRCRTER